MIEIPFYLIEILNIKDFKILSLLILNDNDKKGDITFTYGDFRCYSLKRYLRTYEIINSIHNLSDLGFITIIKENQYHINYDVINSYKSPLTEWQKKYLSQTIYHNLEDEYLNEHHILLTTKVEIAVNLILCLTLHQLRLFSYLLAISDNNNIAHTSLHRIIFNSNCKFRTISAINTTINELIELKVIDKLNDSDYIINKDVMIEYQLPLTVQQKEIREKEINKKERKRIREEKQKEKEERKRIREERQQQKEERKRIREELKKEREKERERIKEERKQANEKLKEERRIERERIKEEKRLKKEECKRIKEEIKKDKARIREEKKLAKKIEEERRIERERIKAEREAEEFENFEREKERIRIIVEKERAEKQRIRDEREKERIKKIIQQYSQKKKKKEINTIYDFEFGI